MHPVLANFERGKTLLTDGGIETRLIYEFACDLPEFASFLPLYRSDRESLLAIYRSYLDVALAFGLPMQIGTPTWRAHPECLARLGWDQPYDLQQVNQDAVQLLQSLRAESGLVDRVAIAGVVGPRRDGYDPLGAPDAEAAYRYHRAQVQVLGQCGVDLLYAPTFASAQELLGVARAMAETSLPYALAPVVLPEGTLPDGTSLMALQSQLQRFGKRQPLAVLAGCSHPLHVAQALRQPVNAPMTPDQPLLAGLKANASALPLADLERLHRLDEGNVTEFAQAMLELHQTYGLRILGGCCGTDARHITALAQVLGRLDA